MPTLTLFVPSLFWPDARNNRAYDGLDLRWLETILGRSAATDYPCADESQWLCARFDVPRQGDWPAGALSALGAGIDPGRSGWFCADPVYLDARRDHLVLQPLEPGSLDAVEAQALVESLNLHFAQDGIHFVAPRADRWLARVTGQPRIITTPIVEAIGRDVRPLLPRGEDRMAWHRLFNEAQMLLHADPVNAERERRGVTPVNSIWFWGGGSLPEVHAEFDAVAGDGDLVRGLCRRAGISVSDPAAAAATIGAERALLEFSQAAAGAMHGNLHAWQSGLRDLEARFLAPLVAHLREGRLSRLTLATVAGGRGWEWSARRRDLWKLWKRPRSLDATAENLGLRR